MYRHTVHRKDKNNKKEMCVRNSALEWPFLPGCGVVPCSYHFFKVFVRFQGFLSYLRVSLFCLIVCMSSSVPPALHVPESIVSAWHAPPPTIARVPTLVDHEFFSRRGTRHSSLALEFSSRGEIVGRFSPVALWDALRVATVWRRTRTSRQSLSLLLHSLEAAEELSEVLCWHDGWLLFSVPTELLSEWMIHRTSQHSVSGWVCRFSDSPWSEGL